MPNSFSAPSFASSAHQNECLDLGIESTLNSFKWLFDSIQSQPLTQEQQIACVDNSQCQLLVAAAGSGKTSTMVGKVAYSIASGQLKPEQILVLAFNVSAAKELSERISSSLYKTLGDKLKVKTSTLHALGLEILMSSNSSEFKYTENYKNTIEEVIKNACETDAEFADNYLLFLNFYYRKVALPGNFRYKVALPGNFRYKVALPSNLRYKVALFSNFWRKLAVTSDFKYTHKWHKFVKENGFSLNKLNGFLSLKGELVFTQFEQAVANWLYAHGIEYNYKHSKHIHVLKRFLPMFRYGKLNYEACFELPITPSSTQPFSHIKLYCINSYADKKYIKYKKNCKNSVIKHAFNDAQNNTLKRDQIFISAQQFLKNTGFKRLTKILGLLGIKLAPIDFNQLRKQHSHISELFLNEYQTAFLQSYIRSSRLSFNDNFSDKSIGLNKTPNSKKHTTDKSLSVFDLNRINLHTGFLSKLCVYYEKHLSENKLLDFESMLSDASKCVYENKYKSKYKLILVDEFQDTSGASIKLIQAMLQQNPGNKLFAVGDDWQSIYSFAGALPDVMINFDKYFDGYSCTTNHLTNTFRFNQHIADTASNFVQSNPMQIKKKVVAHSAADLNSIKLYYCASINAMYMAAHQCLLKINNDVLNSEQNIVSKTNNTNANGAETNNNKTKTPSKDKFSVYILGRYKHQIPPDLESWQAEFPMLNISFSTVHAAKGMQADAVIILGLHTGKYGFPSQVKSDALLDVFSSNNDAFPHAQERRLFYVALTRTKGDVYLLAGKRSPSPFIAEVASSILPENTI